MSLQRKIWVLGCIALAVATGLAWVAVLLGGMPAGTVWGAAAGGLLVLLVLGFGLGQAYGRDLVWRRGRAAVSASFLSYSCAKIPTVCLAAYLFE